MFTKRFVSSENQRGHFGFKKSKNKSHSDEKNQRGRFARTDNPW